MRPAFGMGTGFALVLRFCGTLGYGFVGSAGFGGGTGNGVRFGDGNGGCDGRSGEVSFGGLPFIGKADSIYDAIKNALAVKSERKELIHNGMVGSGRFAVGGGAVLCRFGFGCRFVNGIHGQNG